MRLPGTIGRSFMLALLAPALVSAQMPVSVARRDATAADRRAGSLVVTSVPDQASVTIDGVPRGRTPLALHDLTLDAHRVLIARDGYLENSRVVVISGEPQPALNVTLTKDRSAELRAAAGGGQGAAGGGGSAMKWLIPIIAGGGVAAALGVLKAKSSDTNSGPPPSGSISAGTTGVGIVGVTSFSFNAGVSGGSSPFTYAWDFGDGQTAGGQSVAHIYSLTGTFTVKLTVTDGKGATSTPQTSTVQVGSLTGVWTVAISPAPSTNVVVSFTQTAGTLAAALDDVALGGGPRTGTGTGTATHPKAINATVTYAAGVNVTTPFAVSFSVTGDTALNVLSGTATGYAGCPCTVSMTRQ